MLRINNLIGEILFTTAQDAVNAGFDLKEAAKAMDGLEWYLSFGTALGMYRDKDFIKGDTDIDISVRGEVDPDMIIDRLHRYQLVRSVTLDGDQMQLAFQGDDRFLIDISFFYPNDKGWYSYCEGGMWQDKDYKIGELATKYGIFPVLTPIEDYLKDRYGDWQTPKYGAITSSIKA